MMPSAKLIARAVRGTFADPKDSGTITAATLLRERGIRNLQEQAGYLPPCLPERIEIPANSHHIQYAKQIVPVHEVQPILKLHPQLTTEWIYGLCAAEKQIPDELIPDYLDIGTRQKRLRGWLKHIISDMGTWFVEYTAQPKWAWYLSTELVDIHVLVRRQAESFSQTMYAIDHALTNDHINHRRHIGLSKLLYPELVWTRKITQRLLDALEVSHAVATYQENSLLVSVIKVAGYKLPLFFAPALLRELETGCADWQPIHEELTCLFDVRRTMLSIIRKVA